MVTLWLVFLPASACHRIFLLIEAWHEQKQSNYLLASPAVNVQSTNEAAMPLHKIIALETKYGAIPTSVDPSEHVSHPTVGVQQLFLSSWRGKLNINISPET